MTNREQRRAMLRDQIDGGDSVVENVDAVDPAPAVVETPAPAQNVSLSFEQLKELLALASGGQNIGSQLSQALKENRQPLPENAEDLGITSFHPGGRSVPRPVLKAPTFYGVWDAQTGVALPWVELESAQLTDDEIVALNALEPCVRTIQRHDGTTVQARVVVQDDGSGGIHRIIVAFPKNAYEKEYRNTLPSIEGLAKQLVAA